MILKKLDFIIRHKVFDSLVKIGITKKRPLIDKPGKIDYTFYGKEILAGQDGNNLCRKILEDESPCMLARIGTVEMGLIQAALDKIVGLIKKIGKSRIELLCNNAGFFPNDEKLIEQFIDIYIEAAKEMDIFAVFCNHGEDFFSKNYAPNAKLVQFTTFEPFYFKKPWSGALAGKKVLVIHPFEESIKYQYKRRKLLFDDPEVLPDFELKTLRAVQSIGDNTEGFKDWFSALKYMEQKIKIIDFDIALIGCGAYAFPLAAYIKKLGKKSIVTAGATQLLFGIKGARWDNAETPVPYNDNWIRPKESERPKGAQSVEDGCYW